MKRFVLLFILLLVFVFNSGFGYAEDRYAACDLCGYCPDNPPPQKWLDCKKCIYPNASNDPSSKDTLRIADPNTNIPPTPQPGAQYTMLGCVGTNLGGFQQQGAAAGVVQKLLNVIFSVAGGLAFLSIIYGSFIIMTSQSNPERLNYGKKVVVGAIVGVIFAVSSVFLVNLLGSGILKIPGFSGTNPAP